MYTIRSNDHPPAHVPMASMSRNTSQTLMGFSVHQPEIGAPLQFFPAMGSKELDDLIDAYVPGQASILEKRAAVSLEFFDHSIQSGELFKFFLVYPSLPSATTSPASLQDSGYASSFNTSPAMSESQWTIGSSNYSAHKARSGKKSPSAASRSQAADFSHIPGMKIMTRDGHDVTNSASRGCKTKEQRDHAHLMRIIKACDSCRRKKTRCDPSHKKRGSSASSSPEPQASKRTKTSAAPPPKKAAASQASFELDLSFDATIPESFSFGDSFATVADATVNEWDQFIAYDDEVTDTIPYDYDFFSDPAGYFSPAATNTSSSASSSQILTPNQSQILTPNQSQPITPADIVGEAGLGHVQSSTCPGGRGVEQQPTLPYLHPEGVEVGNNYVDFALYSPGSTCLDDDPATSSQVAAPAPDYSEYSRSDYSVPASHASQRSESSRPLLSEALRDNVGSVRLRNTAAEIPSPIVLCSPRLFSPERVSLFDTGDHDRADARDHSSTHSLGLNSWNRGMNTSRVTVPAHSPESRVPGVTGPPGGDSSPPPPVHALPSASVGAVRISDVVETSSHVVAHTLVPKVSELLHSVENMESVEKSVTRSNTLASDASHVAESSAANIDLAHEQHSMSFRHQRRLRLTGSGAARDTITPSEHKGVTNKATYENVGSSSSNVLSRAGRVSSAQAEASGLLLASAATATTAAIATKALPISSGSLAVVALNLAPVVVLLLSQIRSRTCKTGCLPPKQDQSKTQHRQSEQLSRASLALLFASLVATTIYLVIGARAVIGVAGVALSFLAPSPPSGQKHSITGMKLLEAGSSRGVMDNSRSRFCGLLPHVSGRRNVLNGNRAAWVRFIK